MQLRTSTEIIGYNFIGSFKIQSDPDPYRFQDLNPNLNFYVLYNVTIFLVAIESLSLLTKHKLYFPP